VHEGVLASGMKVAGCSVHFVTEVYDEGPIIIQRAVDVRDDDTPDSLAARILPHEHAIYVEAIRRFALGRLRVAEPAPGTEDAPVWEGAVSRRLRVICSADE
jgi:phosphoribosylglycinamide formyltransferase-1